MRHIAHNLICLLVLTIAMDGGLCVAQNSQPLVNFDTVHANNCREASGLLYYDNECPNEIVDVWAVVDGNGSDIYAYLCLLASISGNELFRLRVWDGDTATGTLLTDTDHPFNYAYDTARSGLLTLHLQRSLTSTAGISLNCTWHTNSSTGTCVRNLSDLQASDITHNTVTLTWVGNANIYVVETNGITQFVTDTSFTLNNLEPNTYYTFTVNAYDDLSHPCCSRTITILTDPAPGVGCPDITDFEANNMRAYYGDFVNPYKKVGIIDYGPTGYFSRHTLHTDTTETDPRTNNALRTVCPGTSASLRLGNWNIGSQAEAVAYSLYIDTNVFALLLLRYAVVLQNPDHVPSAQPRFKLQILNQNDSVIDPVCGVAEYYGGCDPNWHEGINCTWKDWTTVGFDLTPYHGQVIKVRFTTYDCAAGAHFGYAYFSTECLLNRATTEYCGSADSNTITAPNGFNYLWYFDDPANPISTNQTVHFANNDAMLHCLLISTENPNCRVSLNTYAGHRWPLAIADTLFGTSLGCDGYQLNFVNRSTVVNDDGDTTGELCETATWYFGDNYMSTIYSPSHVYRSGGNYDVTLIAGIAGGQCRDTTHFVAVIPPYYEPAVIDTTACDSLLIDSVWYTHDTIGPTLYVAHPDDCDTLYTFNIHIVPTTYTDLPVDTFCYSAPYSWHGQHVGHDTITAPAHYFLTDTVKSVVTGCDSVLRLPLVQLPRDNISIDRLTDCSGHRHRLTAHTNLPYLRWSATPDDPALAGHEHDTIVYLDPELPTLYLLTTDYRDTVYCPSVATVQLRRAEFPSAELEINPDALTIEHTDFDAYDVSNQSLYRYWSLVFHGDGDTLDLAETSRHLYYALPSTDIDSLTVILTIGNDMCLDTVSQTLPLLHITFWAPNVFTPDRETNNRFVISAEGLIETELSIYDRAGRIVYTDNNIEGGWDGCRLGQPCPQGAYVWYLRYRTLEHPSTWQTASGTVTLIR